ncbi:MAG: VOC family protein [Gordonia sp. (in: high G+C Gram-positive bacteria)]
MPHHHHAIDYVEFSAPDIGASKDFYSTVFGWEFVDYGPEYAGFKGPNTGGDPDHRTEAGGLAADGPSTPLVIVYSDDVDASLDAVVAAGGTVITGPYSFPGGRRFHFTDPSGNELAVWGPEKK